jgi:HAD superfamily hydrolase (TIGR01509 family)
MLRRVKALLIDLYDTIVWTDWQDISQRVSRKLGVEPAALYRGFEASRLGRGTGRFGSVAGDMAAVASGSAAHVTPAILDELAGELVTFLRGHVHLYEDVLPALRQLRASGVPVAIVSNCDHATRPAVDHLGLAREVDAVVLSFEVGSVKPDAPIFQSALSRLNAAPADCLFVDDQDRYLDGAAALGLATLRMERDRPSPPGPHPVVRDMRAVVEWFGG